SWSSSVKLVVSHASVWRKQQPQPSHQVFGGGGGTEVSAEYELHATQHSQSGESDVRVAQLEKENFMLKTRIKQLEDTVTQLDQQLKDAPALASELQRRLHEAGDLAAQLVKSTAAGEASF
uniref:Cnn_1N domain-containing protein n=1 Tax=Macrostomum lignano TaxID=282301 RepID=A0A1I8FFL4_9PLAT